MRIPIQAQPVHRTSEVLAFPEGGIAPSGDGCPSGKWCCVGPNGQSTCMGCGSTPCFVSHAALCHSNNMAPANNC